MTAGYLHCLSRDVTAITKKAISSREPRGGSAEGAVSCERVSPSSRRVIGTLGDWWVVPQIVGGSGRLV
jgi:hypothetical protein